MQIVNILKKKEKETYFQLSQEFHIYILILG